MTRVRRARMDDIPALRALCRAAAGADDYVLGYLRWMVQAREAVVVVVSGRLVAMGGITECADRALWIGQLRTHPDFRRRGYATMLLEHAYSRALREGRPALRLFTGLRNASRSLYRAYGFREVGGFTRRVAPALRTRAGLLRMDPGSRALHGLWRESLFARAGQGFLAYRWHMLPLTLTTLRMVARRGQVLSDGRAAILAWAEEGERAAFASVLAGEREGLRAARSAAALLGRRTVEVFLPVEARILQWAEETGYRRASWGRHLMLYERRVRGEP